MGDTYRNFSSVTISSKQTATLPLPSGLASGDVVYAHLNFVGSSVPTITPVDSWLVVGEVVSGATINRLYRRLAGPSEPPGGYVFNSNVSCSGTIAGVAWDDASNATPEDVAASSNSGSGTTATATGITTTTDGCQILMFVGAGGSTTVTPDATFTNERYELGSRVCEDADYTQISHGATGDRTATLGTSRAWATFLVALRPAVVPKGLTGTIAPTGGVIRQIRTSPGGTLNLSGALSTTLQSAGRYYTQALEGSLNYAGDLVRRAGISPAGALFLSGEIARTTSKSVEGAIGFSGGLAKRTLKALSGVLRFVGNLVAWSFRTPDKRQYHVPAETRTLAVEGDPRSLAVEAELRTLPVEAESRLLAVADEQRSLNI